MTENLANEIKGTKMETKSGLEKTHFRFLIAYYKKNCEKRLLPSKHPSPNFGTFKAQKGWALARYLTVIIVYLKFKNLEVIGPNLPKFNNYKISFSYSLYILCIGIKKQKQKVLNFSWYSQIICTKKYFL